METIRVSYEKRELGVKRKSYNEDYKEVLRANRGLSSDLSPGPSLTPLQISSTPHFGLSLWINAKDTRNLWAAASPT